jgi:diketogulonate reductase-like aldo/keto reductase
MIGSLLKLLFGRLLPALVLFVSIFLGWCNLDSRYPWEARFFVVIIPLIKGYLPPIIFGHGKLGDKMTPPVPSDLTPKPRPTNELFATLQGSGDSMPLNGLGMCCRPTAYDDVSVERTIEWYLLLGGRHIDGADLYLNHEAIGKGIQNAMAKGIPREEIFLTTKVYPFHFGYKETTKVVESSLEELGLGYLDMVLMHAPARLLPGAECTGCKGLTNKECRQETWRALSDLRRAGKIRNAGVSNFASRHLEELFELYSINDSNSNTSTSTSTSIAPVSNNQIQWNPWAPLEWVETVAFCRSKNIQITAYNSLRGAMEGHKIHTIETLTSLSSKHSRSVSQIMLRWAIQSGAAIIPGTGNPKYMEENLSVYDFELSEADMGNIDGLREELTGQFFTMEVLD